MENVITNPQIGASILMWETARAISATCAVRVGISSVLVIAVLEMSNRLSVTGGPLLVSPSIAELFLYPVLEAVSGQVGPLGPWPPGTPLGLTG